MGTRMQQRRGTAAEWAADNPILSAGEIGFELDTKVFKVGDGSTRWTDLQTGTVDKAGGSTITASTVNTVPLRLQGIRNQAVDIFRVETDTGVALGVNSAGVPYSGPNNLALSNEIVPVSLFDAAGDLLVGTGADTVARLPRGTAGQNLRVNSAGTALEWATPVTTKTTRVPHTFTVSGEVRIPSGDDFYIPPFFVPVPTGQTVKLSGLCRTRINSGTQVALSLTRNGTVVQAGIGATPTTQDQSYPVTTLTNGDAIAIVVTGVTGVPKNLSVTLYLDYTV